MSFSLQGPIVWLVGGAVLLSEKVELGGCGFHAVISNFSLALNCLHVSFFAQYFSPLSSGPALPVGRWVSCV